VRHSFLGSGFYYAYLLTTSAQDAYLDFIVNTIANTEELKL